MSREWTHYRLECVACGACGKLGMWSEDWGGWDIQLEGFSGRVWVTGPQPSDLTCEECGSKEARITEGQKVGTQRPKKRVPD